MNAHFIQMDLQMNTTTGIEIIKLLMSLEQKILTTLKKRMYRQAL